MYNLMHKEIDLYAYKKDICICLSAFFRFFFPLLAPFNTTLYMILWCIHRPHHHLQHCYVREWWSVICVDVVLGDIGERGLSVREFYFEEFTGYEDILIVAYSSVVPF